MRLVKQFLAVAAIAFIGNQGIAAVRGNPWLTLAVGVVTAVLAIVVYAWVVRRTERRAPTEVARSGAVRRLSAGVLIGVAMFSAVIVNIAFLGGYHVHGWGSVTGALALLGFMAAAAVTEELLFRGVLFRIIEERTGTWIALLLTGSVFGLIHLANPAATLWGAIAIAIEAGFMLAACYAATRNLWVPIGVHFGWNFAAGRWSYWEGVVRRDPGCRSGRWGSAGKVMVILVFGPPPPQLSAPRGAWGGPVG